MQKALFLAFFMMFVACSFADTDIIYDEHHQPEHHAEEHELAAGKDYHGGHHGGHHGGGGHHKGHYGVATGSNVFNLGASKHQYHEPHHKPTYH